MEIEDQIEFADVSEILVEDLNKGVDELKHNKLVLVLIDDGNEVETGVSLVDDFVLFVFQEIAHFGFTSNDKLIYLCIRGEILL